MTAGIDSIHDEWIDPLNKQILNSCVVSERLWRQMGRQTEKKRQKQNTVQNIGIATVTTTVGFLEVMEPKYGSPHIGNSDYKQLPANVKISKDVE